MTTTYINKVEKGRDGWKADAVQELTIHGQTARVTVSTYKDINKRLSTTIGVGWVYNRDGFTSVITRLGFGGPGGDLRRTLLRTESRCTEKTVREQQDQALAVWPHLINEVQTYYANIEALPQDLRDALAA